MWWNKGHPTSSLAINTEITKSSFIPSNLKKYFNILVCVCVCVCVCTSKCLPKLNSILSAVSKMLREPERERENRSMEVEKEEKTFSSPNIVWFGRTLRAAVLLKMAAIDVGAQLSPLQHFSHHQSYSNYYSPIMHWSNKQLGVHSALHCSCAGGL